MNTMNRRTVLSASAALIMSQIVGFAGTGQSVLALATAEPVVATYDQVGLEYAAASEGLLK